MTADAAGGSRSDARRVRIGALAPYPAGGPSTRYRLVQLQAPLRDRGIEVEILPFMDDDAYRRIYGASSLDRARVFAGGWWRRVRDLRDNARFDAWIVHRELAPLGNRFLEGRLARTGRPYVFDFDDAIYLPQPGGDPGVRRVRDPDADAQRFARNAAAVFAGNAELASFAERARGGAGTHAPKEGVHIVPTVVDTDRYRPAAEVRDRVVVGWVGTHTTAPYLEPIVPALRKLMETTPFIVRVVSNRAPDWLARAGEGFEFVRWSGEREVEQVQEFSIGLYPLEDTPWERGKCGLKAIQYMACGIPVVGSRVGVLPEVVPDGEAGLLVNPGSDWTAPLAELLRDHGWRAGMGVRGREQAERRYSVASIVDRVAGILRDVAERGRRAEAPHG